MALEELSPEQTHDAWLLATSDLADILLTARDGNRTGNLRRAIALLQPAIVAAGEDDDAIVSLHRRLELAYQQLAVDRPAAESAAGLEVLCFKNLDGWFCGRRFQSQAQRLEEWLPEHDSLDDWRELITMEARWGAGAMPFRGLLVDKERHLRSHMTTGDFTFFPLSQTAHALIYVWSVEGDFAIEDQYELVQVRRGEDGLHFLHKAVRGKSLERDREAAAQWIERLQSAVLSRPLGPPEPVRGEAPEASNEEIQERISRLARPPDAPIDDPAGFLKEALSGVGRGSAPELYASLCVGAGLHLLRSETAISPAEIEEAKNHFREPPPDLKDCVSYAVVTPTLRTSQQAIGAAIRSFRLALEIFTRDTRPEIWARSMTNLARAFFRRDPVGSRRNIMLARHGFEQAIEIYATRQMHDEFADILADLGRLHSRLGVIGDHAEYAAAIEYFSAALRIHTLQTHPLEWAEETFNLADVYRATAALTRDDAALREAESRYAAVVTAISSDDRFKIGTAKTMEPDGQLRMGSANKLLGFATKELQYIDRTSIPEPRTRAGSSARPLARCCSCVP